jgi:hypothetical protein
MASTEEPIELSTLATRLKLEPDLERSGDLAQNGERHLGDLSSLDPRDDRLRYAGPFRQVDLAPSALQPRRPDGGPEPKIFHSAMVASRD